jgi:VWFA-related protein
VVTNAHAREGRLVMILLDQSIPEGTVERAREVARSAVNQLAPGDLASVAYASAFSKNGTTQDFTSDRARLLAAIDRPFFGLTVPPTMSAGGLTSGDPYDNGATCYCGVCMLDTVARSANAVRDVPLRRKSLVLIASGSGVYIQAPASDLGNPRAPAANCGNLIEKSRTAMLDALRAANVTIHAFDPTGLETLARGLPSGIRSVGGATRAETRERQNVLHTLADHTGGRAYTNTNDPAFHVPDAFRESETYYIVGFERAAKLDGKAHKIDVEVTKPGVHASTRRDYVASPSATTGAVSSAGSPEKLVAGSLPEAAVPLSMVIAPFAAASGADHDVAIVVGVKRPDAEMPASRPMQIWTAAYGPKGDQVIDFRQRFTVDPPVVAVGDVEYEIVSRLPLKPGRYQIRAGVHTQGAPGGSVYADIEVPDFGRDAVSLSGVVLSAAPAAPAVPPGGLAGSVPITPTTRRQFKKTDRVATFARVYEGAGRPLAPAQVTVRVLDAQGRVAVEQAGTLDVARFSAARSADVRFSLPLETLTTGSYLLTISAAVGPDSVRRDVPFTVR